MRVDAPSAITASLVRRRAFASFATVLMILTFVAARHHRHGAFIGTWKRHAEAVFDKEGLYIGAHRGPRSTGGAGFSTSLSDWRYLSGVGGVNGRGWGGVRWATAPFFLFVVLIPWWLVAVVVLLPACLLSIRIKRRPSRATCAVCNYDLRATPDRCPECGTIPAVEQVQVGELPDARVAFWFALTASAVTAADLMLDPRDRVPSFASLVYWASLAMSLPLLASAWWLARRTSRYAYATVALVLFSLMRLLIPRLY